MIGSRQALRRSGASPMVGPPDTASATQLNRSRQPHPEDRRTASSKATTLRSPSTAAHQIILAQHAVPDQRRRPRRPSSPSVKGDHAATCEARPGNSPPMPAICDEANLAFPRQAPHRPPISPRAARHGTGDPAGKRRARKGSRVAPAMATQAAPRRAPQPIPLAQADRRAGLRAHQGGKRLPDNSSSAASPRSHTSGP